ncbi:MAG TPA: PqqD family protein [Melioribacteraceae bacterium]|nr:PqqD family protein [Melioribacteraceae bacterium]
MKNLKIPSNIAISDSGFIFHPSNGETFTVNSIGGEIIKLLKEDKSFEEICSFIVDEYDVDEKTINKDLGDFLNQLKNLNIIKEI